MSSGDKTSHGSSNHLAAPSAVPVSGSHEAKTMRRSSSQQNMFKNNPHSSHPSRSSSPQPVQGAYVREVSARPLGMEIGKESPHVNYEHTFRSDKRHAQQQQRDIVKQQKEAQAQAAALAQAAQAAQNSALALVRHLSSTPPPPTPPITAAAAPGQGASNIHLPPPSVSASASTAAGGSAAAPASASGVGAGLTRGSASGPHFLTGVTPPLSPATPLPGDISGGALTGATGAGAGGVSGAAGTGAGAGAGAGTKRGVSHDEVSAAAEMFTSASTAAAAGSGAAAASPSLTAQTGAPAPAAAATMAGTGAGNASVSETFVPPSFVSYPGYSITTTACSGSGNAGGGGAGAPETPTRAAAAAAAAAAAGAAGAGGMSDSVSGIDPAVVASVVANAVAAAMVADPSHAVPASPSSSAHLGHAPAPIGAGAGAGATSGPSSGVGAGAGAGAGAGTGAGVVLGPGPSDVDMTSLTEAITRSLLSAAGHELPPGSVSVATPLTGAMPAPADCYGLPPLPRSATPTPTTTTGGAAGAAGGAGASGTFPFPLPAVTAAGAGAAAGASPAGGSSGSRDAAAVAAAAASAAAATSAAAAASTSAAAPAAAAAAAAAAAGLTGTPPLSAQQQQLQQQVRRPVVVLKIGSSSISGSDGRLSLNMVSSFVELVCDLRRDGYDVIVCTSGAVSVGCQRLGIRERPKNVVTKQAIAAVGQGRLMRLYDDLFSLLGQPIAQVLLSRENLAQEHHYLNSLNTFKELLRLGIVPVVNENDTVAVQELRFGDNDTLSALVAAIVQANWLFLLTDVDALYTANPRVDPTARAVRVVPDVNSLSVDTGDANPLSGKWGTGGMATKLQAASIATSAGVRTAVCSTERLGDVRRMLQGYTDVGTQFVPSPVLLAGRKKWIALGLVPVGNLVLDEGAATSIIKKRSLFAVGITAVAGRFPANSAVRLVSPTGKELGRGLTMYSSRELGLIKGKHSDEYAIALGYNGPAAVVHRENLALFPSAYSYAEEVMRAGGPRSAQAAAIAAAAARGKRHLRFAVPEPGIESDDAVYQHGTTAGAAGAPVPTVTAAAAGSSGSSGMRRSHSSTSVAAAISNTPPVPAHGHSHGHGHGHGADAGEDVGVCDGKDRSASPAYLSALAGGVEVVARPDSSMSTASFAK